MSNFTEQDVINICTISGMIAIMVAAYILGYNHAKENLYGKKKKTESTPPPDHHWNYRIGTRLVKYTDDVKAIKKEEAWREYLVFTCYYTNNIPDGVGESNNTNGFDDLESLKYTIDKINLCMEKDVIDLDNFPQVFKA
jgi:hypothetical protein